MLASINYTLSANTENLTLVGSTNINVTGSEFDNVLTGNAGNNVLSGGAGNDILNGVSGSDQLFGGAGDDTYIVSDSAATIIEAADEGTDLVKASLSQTLSANVENLTLTGSADINGTGNDQNNNLIGNIGANILSGGAGNDLLSGGLGDDTLMGGAGDDTYFYQPGDGTDVIVDTQGHNTLRVGGGLNEWGLEADRVNDDMVVHVIGANEYITLSQWFSQPDGVINTIEFDDGTRLDRKGIEMLINRPPVVSNDSFTVYEDGGAVSLPYTNLLANDTDPNPGDHLTVVSVGSSVVGATVTMQNGEVIYDIGSSFQELGQGDVLQDSFSYTISDDKGATATGLVEVGIIGVNDAPVTTPDNAFLTEDLLTSVSGNVLTNDTDIDAGTVLSVAAPGSYTGTYGAFELAADGSYLYALNSTAHDVQSLGRTAEAADQFDYAATDGLAVTPSTLKLAIKGINDAPIISKPLADQDLTYNKPFSWQMPSDSFIDIDKGDALTYTATLADGSALPEWLQFDASTGTFSGWTPKQIGTMEVRVSATDNVAATGSTEGSLSVSDVFSLTVSHGNEGLGNGQDAAPAGHDYNQNDGLLNSKLGSDSLPLADDLGTTTTPAASTNVSSTTAGMSQDTATGQPGNYLDVEQLDEYLNEFDKTVFVNNVNMAAQWQKISNALAHDLANLGNAEANSHRLGADTGFGRDMAGTLGSTQAFTMDTTLASGNCGTELKGFNGLQEGMKRM